MCRVCRVKIDEKSKRTKFNWISPQLNKAASRGEWGGEGWRRVQSEKSALALALTKVFDVPL